MRTAQLVGPDAGAAGSPHEHGGKEDGGDPTNPTPFMTGRMDIQLHEAACKTRWERLTRLEARAVVDQGLLTERTRRRLIRPNLDAQRRGDLVCLDALYVVKFKGVGKVWQLTACDAGCTSRCWCRG